MGQPVGLPYTDGDDCVICWGLGKPFGNTGTPDKVYLKWTGLIAPFLGGNKTFIGIQNPGLACQWNFNDGVFFGNWTYQALVTGAVIQLVADPLTLIFTTGPLCTLICTNLPAVCRIS